MTILSFVSENHNFKNHFLNTTTICVFCINTPEVFSLVPRDRDQLIKEGACVTYIVTCATKQKDGFVVQRYILLCLVKLTRKLSFREMCSFENNILAHPLTELFICATSRN